MDSLKGQVAIRQTATAFRWAAAILGASVLISANHFLVTKDWKEGVAFLFVGLISSSVLKENYNQAVRYDVSFAGARGACRLLRWGLFKG